MSLSLLFFKKSQKSGHVREIFWVSNVINYIPKEAYSRGTYFGECMACLDQTKVMVRTTTLQGHLSPMLL